MISRLRAVNTHDELPNEMNREENEKYHHRCLFNRAYIIHFHPE